MAEELSNWIYTFLHVFYFKWATDPQELREFYRESSSLTRKMDPKATQPVHEEQANGVEQCMMRMKECGKLNGEVKILLVDYQNIHIESEGLMISVFGVITPKNVMDGSISRHFSHNFLLLRKTNVWHIQNDIFRIIPPMPLFGIQGLNQTNNTYPLFVRGGNNHYTPGEETEENAQPSPPPPGNFRPMESQQQITHPPPAGLSAQHFGPTSPPNLPPPTNPPNQHFEPGPQAPIPNWAAPGVTDSSAMYPPERFSAGSISAPLVPNTGAPPGHLDVPAGLSRDPLPEQPPANLSDFEPGPPHNGAGMPLPDQSKHQMPPVEEQPQRVAPTAAPGPSGPPPMSGPTELEAAQPPQEPPQAREQIPAEPVESAPKKPFSWANITKNKSGSKDPKPQLAAPQPIIRQPEPVSSAQRGGRRKQRSRNYARGGGRGGGPSPANKRKPFRGGDLKSKPAIFFQAKETDTKAFNELGITEKVLGDQFQKYGSLAKVDVRAKYGFIYFETEEGRNKAMDVKEVEINGLTIRVERKRPQPRSYGGQNRGGGRGGSRGGARGGRGGRRSAGKAYRP